MTIQEKIKLLRKEKGLKQAELAEKCHVSDAAVGAWEQGVRIPHLDNLVSLADAFKVSLDVFRPDAVSLDLPHPNDNAGISYNEPVYNGIPLRFGSSEPHGQQSRILDFCTSYLNTLDDKFFVKGVGQNSEYGTGRYFWESKIDLLMWIGFTPSLQEKHSGYTFSVAVNTETPLPAESLVDFNALQITDGPDENWVHVPIMTSEEKDCDLYSPHLHKSVDTALCGAMKIARKSLENTMYASMKRFIGLEKNNL